MIHLAVSNVHKRFGGLHALKGVTFEVNGPELIGLIGPNGAGKTTLTNVLDGAIKPNTGTVYLNGQRIDQLHPYEVAIAGLGRTFQVTRSFRRMSVLENLYVPALATRRAADRKAIHAKAMEVLEFLTLGHLRNEYAQALSGGQQKLLELGRLLMLDPGIVILDEPFAGVHPRLMEIIYAYIRRGERGGQGNHPHLAPDGLHLQPQPAVAGAELRGPHRGRPTGRGQAGPGRDRGISRYGGGARGGRRRAGRRYRRG